MVYLVLESSMTSISTPSGKISPISCARVVWASAISRARQASVFERPSGDLTAGRYCLGHGEYPLIVLQASKPAGSRNTPLEIANNRLCSQQLDVDELGSLRGDKIAD